MRLSTIKEVAGAPYMIELNELSKELFAKHYSNILTNEYQAFRWVVLVSARKMPRQILTAINSINFLRNLVSVFTCLQFVHDQDNFQNISCAHAYWRKKLGVKKHSEELSGVNCYK